MTAPLLPAGALDDARAALRTWTVEAVEQRLGPEGQAAQQRGDLAGVARVLRGADDAHAVLTRLFLLGEPVDERVARRALGRWEPDAGGETALLERSGGEVRARLEVRPHGDDGGHHWWVVSDFGSDVRPGPLAADHVLGIGAASLTLAQAAVRRPVGRALDLGTGCGVQALHLSAHAAHVVATDVSGRALRFAATTAALSGLDWELRRGSLLEPVADERFDCIVANPPFVVSAGLRPGAGGHDYRDSGLAGDAVSAALVRGLGGLLAPEGTASLLANWIVDADTPWDERVSGWLDGVACDAWVWQREVVDPGGYVSLWLRDAGEQPGTPRWRERYDAWRDWFDRAGVLAVGMGLVTLRRTEQAPVVVCEDVPQPVEQPAGPHIAAWFDRRRWLAAHDDAALLRVRLRAADGLVRTEQCLRAADPARSSAGIDAAQDAGWVPATVSLRQSHGMRWEVESDAAVAAVVGGCDGRAPLGWVVELLAVREGLDAAAVWRLLAPVVRDLVGRGLLEPAD